MKGRELIVEETDARQEALLIEVDIEELEKKLMPVCICNTIFE